MENTLGTILMMRKSWFEEIQFFPMTSRDLVHMSYMNLLYLVVVTLFFLYIQIANTDFLNQICGWITFYLGRRLLCIASQ